MKGQANVTQRKPGRPRKEAVLPRQNKPAAKASASRKSQATKRPTRKASVTARRTVRASAASRQRTSRPSRSVRKRTVTKVEVRGPRSYTRQVPVKNRTPIFSDEETKRERFEERFATLAGLLLFIILILLIVKGTATAL